MSSTQERENGNGFLTPQLRQPPSRRDKWALAFVVTFALALAVGVMALILIGMFALGRAMLG